jgi:CheY-like chemotaxis protein
LVVEDDPLLQGMVEDTLDEGRFKVTAISSAEEAITLLKGKAATYCGREIARQQKRSMRGFPSFT